MVDERRLYVRLASREKVIVNVTENDDKEQIYEFECYSRDLSTNGVRLHGDQHFSLGSRLEMVVHLRSEKKDYMLSGKVKWNTETTESEHLTGVELCRDGSPDLMQWKQRFEYKNEEKI